MQAAVVAAAAALGRPAAHGAGPAGAAAGRLVQHGQVGGGGVGGGALGGGAAGLPHHGPTGLPQQQLGEVGLRAPQGLVALVHHPAGGVEVVVVVVEGGGGERGEGG